MSFFKAATAAAICSSVQIISTLYSGAIAAMKLAEKHCLLGSILGAAYHPHLNMEKEIQSGYVPAQTGNEIN